MKKDEDEELKNDETVMIETIKKEDVEGELDEDYQAFKDKKKAEKKSSQEKKKDYTSRTSRMSEFYVDQAVNRSNINEKNENKKEKKSKKKILKKILLGVLAVILLIIVILAIRFGTYVAKSGGNIKEAAISMATDMIGDDKPIFVLVMGVSKDIASDLSDTMIVAGYNPKSQKAIMLSIPRDTYVGDNEQWANGFDKINSKIQKGPTTSVMYVEAMTGIDLDGYVIVENLALVDIVEAIGEVEFDVPIDMNYDDPTQNLHIHLKKGKQMIDGDKAEQLLRFRHNNNGTSYPSSYGDNDYGRQRTQKAFISAIIDQVVTDADVPTLTKVGTAVYKALKTDINLGKMIGYAPYVVNFKSSDLRSEMMPGRSAMINNLWFYKVDSEETNELIQDLFQYLELTDKEIAKVYKTPKWKSVPTTTWVKPDDCEHNWQVFERIEPTCTKNGLLIEKCLLCEEERKTEIPNTGIKHNYVTTDGSGSPLKDENGNLIKRCTNCGNTEIIEKNPSIGHEHKWVLDQTTKAATCTEAGTGIYKCSVDGCQEVKTDAIAALGHTAPDANGKCTRCGEKIADPSPKPPHEHSYTELVSTDVQPTCGTAGSGTYKCSCGATTSKSIPATGNHTYPEGNASPACSVCGQANPGYTPPIPPPVVPEPEEPTTGE